MSPQPVTTIAWPWRGRTVPLHIGWNAAVDVGTTPAITWLSLAGAAHAGGDLTGDLADLARTCDDISDLLRFGTCLPQLRDLYRRASKDASADLVDELIRLERDHAPAIGYALETVEGGR